ncbi:ATP-dependent nuclease [Microbacterium sp. CCH5-D1]|uniref:ATP-dependent nuclease n=1 Tax=Microbacterium sp. CCH5-D1 TaxID=1768780 RepID=UPI00076A22FC|nr:AAA family ATPase [Microbacterium sp. CCH5-D1]
MRFRVISRSDLRDGDFRDEILLQLMSWNDWWQFKTSYYAYYATPRGERKDLGGVKIGSVVQDYVKSKETNGDRTELPQTFEELPEGFVSVGQDESYYENLNAVLGSGAASVLNALRDLAIDPEVFNELRGTPVVYESLTRTVASTSVEGIFHKIITGTDAVASFDFTFVKPNASQDGLEEPLRLKFAVAPRSTPPTNVHVLIGRNGSGKTTLLSEITQTFLGLDETGCVISSDTERPPVANLVHIGFSAFDVVKVPVEDDPLTYPVAYSYVGLHQNVKKKLQTRPAEKLAGSFAQSAWRVISEKSRDLWRGALETLQSDVNFADAQVSNLANASLEDEEFFVETAKELFGELSSGHKIVLLTITRLVETVTEQSLVLIDEPEGHLHPPLLSALVRALSELMKKRNGVAIIATHSPVVLQEVPANCVHVISRHGSIQTADRPDRETFGENVGVLTSAVFGLEVQASGFHKMLTDAALTRTDADYESIVADFNDELGFEARAILRSWFSSRTAR